MDKKQLKRLVPVLKHLKKLDKDEIENVLPFLNPEVHNLICDCIANCLRNDSIKKKDRLRLKKLLEQDKKTFRYLSNPKVSSVRKRKKLVQVGGFLSTILAVTLPLFLDFLMPKKRRTVKT